MTDSESSGLRLDHPRDGHAAHRSRLYALFAEAFSFPQGANALRLLNGDLVGEIDDTSSALGSIAAESPATAWEPGAKTVQDIQLTYSHLFDVTGQMPAVSLLERKYVKESEQKLWEKLLAFYTHFGLDFSRGEASEQPDHLLTELGFMHYLAFLEAGSPGPAEGLRNGQRDFLDLHLAGWVAAVGDKLRDATPYDELSRRLVTFVLADRDAMAAS